MEFELVCFAFEDSLISFAIQSISFDGGIWAEMGKNGESCGWKIAFVGLEGIVMGRRWLL